MKQINIIRYTGSNHVSLIADKKNNAFLVSSLQATALSSEEAEAQLTSDLSLQVEEEFTLTITDFDRKKFTNLPTEKLLKLYEKTESMLGAKEMMEAILTKRGALTILEEEIEEPQEPVEGEGENEEDTKPVREYKKCMTEECLQARLAEARKNYKKFCKFVCTKDKEEHFGLIRSARLDKRSGFIQYRIEILEQVDETGYDRTGRIYGKGDDSKDLTIYNEDNKPEGLYLAEPTQPAPAKEPAQTEENTNTEA